MFFFFFKFQFQILIFEHFSICNSTPSGKKKKSSADTTEGVKFGVDVIYSDPLSVFTYIACSCTVMPDGTDLLADAQTELLCVCAPVCACVRYQKKWFWANVLSLCIKS